MEGFNEPPPGIYRLLVREIGQGGRVDSNYLSGDRIEADL
jgi:hypothetical protein